MKIKRILKWITRAILGRVNLGVPGRVRRLLEID